jgi:hypothetical protein
MICEELVGVAGARSGRAARWQHCCYFSLRVSSRFWAACPLAGECPGQRVRLCKLCALTCHRRLQMACRCSVACVHINAGGSGGFEGLAVMGAASAQATPRPAADMYLRSVPRPVICVVFVSHLREVSGTYRYGRLSSLVAYCEAGPRSIHFTWLI